MKYEAVIGLEVHAQLATNTKIFCGCSTRFGAEPNTQTCPVCSGMPGALPVMNRKVLEYTVKSGLAMNCRISPLSVFARKNYFYPDLPKGYQISQFDKPICEHGHVEIVLDGEIRRIGITRIHMEEDAGKNLHEAAPGYSLVDLNRACVPLMEIVSEPDIRTPREAAVYMKKVRTILRYLGVCDGNMEQGSLRCDANVSVRPVGQKEFGTRSELKNINSFRFVEKAIEYEIDRQIKLIESGGKVVQETRLWDAAAGRTYSMRGKEEAHDYRYFPDPDLVPIEVDVAWVDGIRASMVELPDAMRERFVSEFGLPEYDAEVLTAERNLAEWFENVVKAGGAPKAASNWIMGDLMKLLNEENRSIDDCPLKPAQLAAMLKLIDEGVISGKIAKTVFDELYRTGKEPAEIVKEKGLVQISDESAIEDEIRRIVDASPKELERYRAGDVKLMGFFVGQVMKATKGKANPKVVNELLRKVLEG
ncbi:MAG: Asp-tRNA(Asn)/Glu-tRNA(Gln) amidotransferase subunit GatB [Nitrospirae bacterium]|nr:Asp-tRNA(Asn)/Glu-tRNA(Gln) amidotransferase subunit GatB [Nitrospirota bacterium]